ncbi:Qat anti-phage system associated protein QatB [Ancylobacter novellus]|uniref:Qat anti-phage system associated protein QatB n=1 Tax=Ancylobacter novellus TaxID=921 RepID=UPI0011871559|nr:Qat anti-phage system associated protein QatB [Ancylobacter novellus]
MGTSTPFEGGRNGNPLIPTWLDSGGDGPAPAASGGAPPTTSPEASPSNGQPELKKEEPPATAQFRSGRTLFNKHIRSSHSEGDGGGDRSSGVRRSIGAYVSRGGGGSAAAARRMSAASAGAASRLGDLLLDASRDGIREVVRRLRLDALAQRSLREIYASLVDFVCGDGGDLDEAMNREAYSQAVDEIEGTGADLEKPSVETINLLIERFIVGTIDNRIVNAIGTKVIVLPGSVAEVEAVKGEVRGYVEGAVKNAMSKVGGIFDRDKIRSTIDRIYERALTVLGSDEDE